MKKSFFYGLLMLNALLMSTACSSDDDSTTSNNMEITEVTNTMQSGTWRISSFIDSGQNETNDFNNYTFTFNTNGTLTANSTSDTQNGTWSITNSSGSSSNDIDFNIAFPVPDTSDFDDLNDDWDIVTYTSSRIDLIDVSGGNGGTDTLTFEKN